MEHKMVNSKAIIFAVLAAALYALNSPVSKLLLEEIQPTMMAAFLYLGAGFGSMMLGVAQKLRGNKRKELPLTKKELPFTVGMIVLDIAAPIFLMVGLSMTTAENASLLNNFEIVATSLIALFVFKEKISKRLWIGIGLVTLSSMILSVEDFGSFSFSVGSVFVLLACVCWGLENNCTRMLSSKNPLEIVTLKGLFSGMGSFIIAIGIGESIPVAVCVAKALILGFVAYGLSIYFYIYAQRYLGAAKTSAYYSIAPFIGVVLSFFIFQEIPGIMFFVALLIMAAGTWFTTVDS